MSDQNFEPGKEVLQGAAKAAGLAAAKIASLIASKLATIAGAILAAIKLPLLIILIILIIIGLAYFVFYSRPAASREERDPGRFEHIYETEDEPWDEEIDQELWSTYIEFSDRYKLKDEGVKPTENETGGWLGLPNLLEILLGQEEDEQEYLSDCQEAQARRHRLPEGILAALDNSVAYEPYITIEEIEEDYILERAEIEEDGTLNWLPLPEEHYQQLRPYFTWIDPEETQDTKVEVRVEYEIRTRHEIKDDEGEVIDVRYSYHTVTERGSATKESHLLKEADTFEALYQYGYKRQENFYNSVSGYPYTVPPQKESYHICLGCPEGLWSPPGQSHHPEHGDHVDDLICYVCGGLLEEPEDKTSPPIEVPKEYVTVGETVSAEDLHLPCGQTAEKVIGEACADAESKVRLAKNQTISNEEILELTKERYAVDSVTHHSYYERLTDLLTQYDMTELIELENVLYLANAFDTEFEAKFYNQAMDAVFAMGDYYYDGYVDEDIATLFAEQARPPISGQMRVTSPYGPRGIHPVTGVPNSFHHGVDLGAPIGRPLYSVLDGVVNFVGVSGSMSTGYGRLVIINHGEIETRYAHLDEFAPGLSVGQQVRAGERIGDAGATGGVTGPHLHFEIRHGGASIDPWPYLQMID